MQRNHCNCVSAGMVVACLLSLLLSSADQLRAEQFGRFSVGGNSYFEAEADNLIHVVDGERISWDHPAPGQRIIQIELGAGDNGFVAYLITADGRIFTGDLTTKIWTERSVPANPISIDNQDLFVPDIFQANVVYWAIGRDIYMSANGAQDWAPIGKLHTAVARLVLSLDKRLHAFEEFGQVLVGEVTLTDEGAVWDAALMQLPIAAGEKVVVGQSGQYLIGRDERERESWRLFSAGTVRESDAAAFGHAEWKEAGIEFSTKNATTKGCRFQVYRWAASQRRWVLDNYWDYDYRYQTFDLQIKQIAGSSECVWLAPFRSLRFELRNAAFTRRVTGGNPGYYGAVAYENDLGEPFVRAVAVHVENPSLYQNKPKNQPLARGTNDNWAIVVQNSRNGRTACEAFWGAPTPSEAARAGRNYLQLPIFGSNPGCPLTNVAAIACVSPDRALKALLSFLPDSVRTFTFALNSSAERQSRGMAECLLPDLD